VSFSQSCARGKTACAASPQAQLPHIASTSVVGSKGGAHSRTIRAACWALEPGYLMMVEGRLVT